MLYTSSLKYLENCKDDVKPFYLIPNHSNDVVVPDEKDLDNFKVGIITWHGFKVNYLSKLMKHEATEWMRRVSSEAAQKDVVLVDKEEDVAHSPRTMLADMIMNMFSGEFKLRYMGELSQKRK